MRLVIDRIYPDREIMHYVDPDLRIASCHNRVFVTEAGEETEITLPAPRWQIVLGSSRLARRGLRLDKCNVVPVGKNLIIVRRGIVYHYDRAARTLTTSLRLRQCRNVLHQAITVLDDREVFFGEYGSNPERGPVPVYRSQDGGRSWETVFEFPAGQIRHVHGCYWDAFEERLWVVTGDFENECQMLVADKDFATKEWIGDGNQMYRTCNLFFEEDAVHWIMDSQLEANYHIKLQRGNRCASRLRLFPGPVWYIKRLADGYYLAATVQEIGPGVRDAYAHFMVSDDLESWHSVHRFEHDGLPKRYLKSGVPGLCRRPPETAKGSISSVKPFEDWTAEPRCADWNRDRPFTMHSTLTGIREGTPASILEPGPPRT